MQMSRTMATKVVGGGADMLAARDVVVLLLLPPSPDDEDGVDRSGVADANDPRRARMTEGGTDWNPRASVRGPNSFSTTLHPPVAADNEGLVVVDVTGVPITVRMRSETTSMAWCRPSTPFGSRARGQRGVQLESIPL